MPRKSPFLTIGEVAARTGLAVSAIRYYADEGLITALRSEGGNRRFTRSEIRKVSFIAISQRLGFSLAEIRGQLDRLPGDRPPTKADWARISTGFRDAIDERMAQLERLRDRLDGCIGCGCLSLDTCAIYNGDDKAAALGPGANWVEKRESDLGRPVRPQPAG
ncbi:redox-sensitive transcriptional activator SoxR [Oceaniradius stylonematis]|uniref:Redox-sensitive transcriptional activator SoxR n=1 Tax=Oceaniradius stylonematis TaxID=2184161 RepID=A0A3A8A6F0_9HYPH|nr:redox-sensitive transcriptional activator SoxR [Oceaniradius stylonematis]RKF05887.1 redox-sensitive transcriptional activator SoxR [Oceaniradius stylonematis]